MQPFIAKIGKGPKASKDLTWEEAKQAMRRLIEGQASPVQVGGFLLAMRMKMESVTELAAFTAVAREYVAPLHLSGTHSVVDLPTYAGKQETFHAMVGAAVVAAATGAAILMHGHEGIPERTSAAAVLARLGIPTDRDPKQIAEEVAARSFAYLDLALYHPPLARFLDLRQDLGVRGFFHPVAKMLNPARAAVQVIGMTHPAYFDKMAEALRMLGCRRALIVRGVEGEPELSIAAVTKVLEVSQDRIFPLTLQPRDVGLAAGSFRDMAGFPLSQIEQEASLLRKILHNEVRGPQRDWVIQNAGLLLYAAGSAASISAAIPLATRALETGAAARKLNELATLPQGTGASPAGHEVSAA